MAAGVAKWASAASNGSVMACQRQLAACVWLSYNTVIGWRRRKRQRLNAWPSGGNVQWRRLMAAWLLAGRIVAKLAVA